MKRTCYFRLSGLDGIVIMLVYWKDDWVDVKGPTPSRPSPQLAADDRSRNSPRTSGSVRRMSPKFAGAFRRRLTKMSKGKIVGEMETSCFHYEQTWEI
ncbi:UNVERIFIED_CONTAM: hypothetical protein PYX00_009290 [Menopon gallinae]|uniref:Uncharacterized protein n=1 Tax=Menopon gallinae TaxID=328185 RepID=A0AAW2HAP4_9NEOP